MAKKLFDHTKGGSAEIRTIDSSEKKKEEIAIVGMAGRFPSADDVNDLWENLCKSVDGITDLPEDRKYLVEQHLKFQNEELSTLAYKKLGYLNHIDQWDNNFFKISRKEASLMDPSQRIFLDTAWHALEHAGYGGEKIRGTKTGIYLGYVKRTNTYLQLATELEPELGALAMTGSLSALMTGRLSYLLDLKGPSLLVDTSCSSSLVAIYLACQALNNADCDYALAAGLQLVLDPVLERQTDDVTTSSATGVIRSFDDNADGTVGGEGCGVLVLKRLSDATRDKDNILAVIKGGAYNQDGNSVGLTAPNPAAQAAVIEKAWKDANINPETISYIEAHGTGTELGDPIEMQGISRAFKRHTNKKQFCALGSLKTNIGHLDAAAGVAGVIKAVQALGHGQIPPSLHFEKPNHKINFEESPVFLNQELIPWEKTNGTPRRCGVSSFGISGTNCHMVLEEAADNKEVRLEDYPHLLVISAKNELVLKNSVDLYQKFTLSLDAEFLSGLCYTAATGREHHQCRLAITFSDLADLKSKLLHAKDQFQKPTLGIYYSENDSRNSEKVVDLQASKEVLEGLNTYSKVSVDYHTVSEKLARAYVSGAKLAWEKAFQSKKIRKIAIPLYPFDKKKCWLEYPERQTSINVSEGTNNGQTPALFEPSENALRTVPELKLKKPSLSMDKIISELIASFSTIFEDQSIDVNQTFLEMGLTSVSIIQVRQLVRNKFDVDIALRKLFDEVSTIHLLGTYIVKNLPEIPEDIQENPSINKQTTPATRLPSDSSLEKIFKDQLDVINRQLDLIQNNSFASGTLKQDVQNLSQRIQDSRQTEIPKQAINSGDENKDPLSPLNAFDKTESSEVSSAQEDFIARFIEKYSYKTKSSKSLTQQYRRYFANNRNVSAYKQELKELTYPILSEKADGSWIEDVDGNKFLDFACGFGVYLLGYNHPKIDEAIRSQLDRGMSLGPLSPLAGEVAKLICELTGVERVAFYNSGTEAVMYAMRLARAATNRTKIVIFEGSYHGTYDGVLLQKDLFNDNGGAIPRANGIPHNVVDNAIYLEYGTERSLKIIEQNINEIAGILVEPVQSRRPDFRPRKFLKELRQLTGQNKVPLIFDEVMNGFRVHPGGAQHWYGIQADLVTYGKIIGGGLPIGVVAGKSEFMHGVDAGAEWKYGDESEPKFDHRKTFLTGTFCHHPLAMAASKAMLTFLKEQGPSLQEGLNEKTTNLASSLNEYFISEEVPVKILHFGSQFVLEAACDPRYLMYLLLDRGIYCWEGMTFFLSCAHTKKEINQFSEAIKACVKELKLMGILKTIKNEDVTFNGHKELIIDDSEQRKLSALEEVEMTEQDNTSSHYKVSFAQKRLWILDRLLSDRSVFNMSNAMKLEGPLSVESLQKAFVSMIHRYEILRTNFVYINSEPRQRLLANSEWDFNIELLDMTSEGEKSSAIQRIIDQERRVVFDLENDLLMRLKLIKIGSDSYIFILTTHHIASDGWSMEIFIRELLQLYYAEVEGSTENMLKPLEFQYKEYAALEHENFINGNFDVHKEFWMNQFSGEIPTLSLPTDFKRPTQKTYNGASIEHQCTEDLIHSLSKISVEQKVSFFTILMSATYILMSRYTGQKDITLGTTTVGRDAPGLENQLGFFVNMLPMRVHFDEKESFNSLLSEVKLCLLDALEHQNYPFDKLVQDLDIPRDTSRAPLFDVLVEFVNIDLVFEQPDNNVTGLKLTDISPASYSTQYDLSFRFIKNEDNLIITLEYNTDLFKRETASKILDQYHHLLQTIGNTPGMKLDEISILSDLEKKRLTEDFNDTKKVFKAKGNILDLFQHQVKKAPTAHAIVDKSNSNMLSYAQLDDESDCLAAYLVDHYKIKAGDIVALYLRNSLELIISMLGVLKCGATFLPLDTSLPATRLQNILEDSNMSLFITKSDELLNLKIEVAQEIFAIDLFDKTSVSVADLSFEISDNCAAYVTYTSGSTGRPKGVLVNHSSLRNYTCWANNFYFNGKKSFDFPLFTSPSFDLTYTSIFTTLTRGDALMIYDAEIGQVLKDIFSGEQQPKVVKLTPSHLRIVQDLEINVTSVEKVIVGGEALLSNHIDTLKKLNPEIDIYNEYGPTEATIGCTVEEITGSSNPHSIGRPISNTQMYILDSNLNLVPENVYGELYIGGDGLAAGYLNDPETTHEKFTKNPFLETGRMYATGDFGRWLSDGTIEYFGRKDLQVKINGNRVDLNEIQSFLLKYDLVTDAYIEAKRNDNGSVTLVAYLERKKEIDNEAIRLFLGQHLPQYMIPGTFISIPDFPMNKNGKLDVSKLETLESASGEVESQVFQPPTNEIEKTISTIWEEVLEKKSISTNANFFDIGGDSIKLVIVFDRITNVYGKDVSVPDLFKYNTIGTLSEYLNDLFQESPAISVTTGIEV